MMSFREKILSILKSPPPLSVIATVDSCFRRNDRKSVCFFVRLLFSSTFEADFPALSFPRRRESILARLGRFSSEKQLADLFGSPRKQGSILDRPSGFSSEKETN
ncbi:MAG: hypothetical protein AAF471_02115 [Myxococcota bacterium]